MALHRTALLGLLATALALIATGCGGEPGEAPPPVGQWDLSDSDIGKLDYAEGLGIGRNGEVLIVDSWNDRIVRTDGDGRVVGAFGKFGYDEGQLQCPRSVATDQQGNIYVVDEWNQRVQKFSPEGKFELSLGSRGGPWGYDEADGKFIFPYGVAVDSRRYIYVSDFNNHRLQMFDPRGKFVMKWGTKGRQDGQVNQPAGLAIDSQDRLYLADLGNSRVQRFVIEETKDGFEAHFDGKWGADDLSKPYDVCVDPEDNFYVADLGAHCVYKFSASGHMMWAYGEHGSGQGELDCPMSVAAAGNDVVYIADHGNNRIVKIAPTS